MSDNSFHQWLPEWTYAPLQKRKCSQCNKKYTKDNIIAVGIRMTEEDFYAMYLETQCSECGFRALTTLGKQKEDSLEKLCYVILESIKKKKITNKSKMIHKQMENKPMTDKEVENFIKFIQTNQTHADFCKKIGVTIPKDKKDDTG